MRNLFTAAGLAVSAVAMAPAASAATFTVNLSGTPLTGGFTTVVSAGAFDDSYEFSIPQDGVATASVISIALTAIGAPGDIDFSGVWLNGTALPFANGFVSLGGNTGPQGVFVANNPQVLRVAGTSIGSGTYSGTVNFTPAVVPEPATWGFMILGFGLVGAAMRRSRVRVAYS